MPSIIATIGDWPNKSIEPVTKIKAPIDSNNTINASSNSNFFKILIYNDVPILNEIKDTANTVIKLKVFKR